MLHLLFINICDILCRLSYERRDALCIVFSYSFVVECGYPCIVCWWYFTFKLRNIILNDHKEYRKRKMIIDGIWWVLITIFFKRHKRGLRQKKNLIYVKVLNLFKKINSILLCYYCCSWIFAMFELWRLLLLFLFYCESNCIFS